MIQTSDGYLLDTHVLVWMMEADAKLASPSVREIESIQRRGEAYCSVMSVWELAQLTSRGRLVLCMTIENWVAEAFRDGGVALAGMTTQIALEANALPEGLHKDPIDRMLAATARVNDWTLLTRDERLLRYAEQGHVKARRI